MVSRDTMRRVVVWISGRGRAANGMVYGSREDGGDPCSVRVTRSHAMLATRALCRLRARVIAILAKTHIVESWASKGSCPQIACFSTKQERSAEPGRQFLTTIFWRSASYLLHFEKRNKASGRACGCMQRARIFLDESAPQEKPRRE